MIVIPGFIRRAPPVLDPCHDGDCHGDDGVGVGFGDDDELTTMMMVVMPGFVRRAPPVLDPCHDDAGDADDVDNDDDGHGDDAGVAIRRW